MSVETILSRMISDSAFAEAVFANAETTLAEYSLSIEDLAKFKGMNRAEFANLAAESRRSFATLPRPGSDPNGETGTNHNETALTL